MNFILLHRLNLLILCSLALVFSKPSPSVADSLITTPDKSAGRTSAQRKRNIPKKIELIPECRKDTEQLRVSFIDVGQGDATLISCPGHTEHILFDAGDSNDVYPQANEKLLSALKMRLGSQPRISIAIGSHPHPDHTFGFTKIFEMVQQGVVDVDRYIDNGATTIEGTKEDKTNNKIRDWITSLKIPYTSLRDTPEYRLPICTNSKFPALLTLRHPGPKSAPKLDCPANFNDCSLMATVEFEKFRIQLMGDATSRWEQHAEEQDNYPLQFPVDILKAGHHGANCCSPKFIQRMQPLLAVVSSGLPNLGSNVRRKYPRAESIKILEANARNSRIFQALPEYQLAAYQCPGKSTRCGWTNYSVPTTLLATAQLGTVDIFLQKERICVSAEHLTTGIDFFFSNETLASDLE